MAERKGFEPLIPLTVYTLSKRAPSTTRPSLHLDLFFIILLVNIFIVTNFINIKINSEIMIKKDRLSISSSMALKKVIIKKKVYELWRKIIISPASNRNYLNIPQKINLYIIANLQC